MKLKENYVLRRVANTWVVLPIGEETVNFNGMLRLNETASVLWTALEKGGSREDLANALTAEYDVTYERALTSVDNFLNMLGQAGCLE